MFLFTSKNCSISPAKYFLLQGAENTKINCPGKGMPGIFAWQAKKRLFPKNAGFFLNSPEQKKKGIKGRNSLKKTGKKKPPAIELPEVFQKKSFPVKGPC